MSVSHFAVTSIRSFWLQSPGTLHKDVGGAGTKVSEKTVGGVGTATLTTLSSINNASNTGRNKNNPVSHEVSYTTRPGGKRWGILSRVCIYIYIYWS